MTVLGSASTVRILPAAGEDAQVHAGGEAEPNTEAAPMRTCAVCPDCRRLIALESGRYVNHSRRLVQGPARITVNCYGSGERAK